MLRLKQGLQVTARHLPTLVVIGCCLGLGGGVALAQESQQVFLPLTFHAEAGPLRTSACLQVVEWAHPQSRWWESERPTASPAQAFKAIVAAMKARDLATLRKLSDASQTRDEEPFVRQAGAFFAQMQNLELVSVPRSYQFDGLLVFFARFQGKTQSAFAPFVFALQGDSYRFLPNRTDLLTYVLVNDWFMAPWGAARTEAPSYCSEAEVKRATHQIALVGSRGPTAQASRLLLAGAPFEAPGPFAPILNQTTAHIEAMKTAVAKSLSELTTYLTPRGAGQLLKWTATASELERENYRRALLGQRPFFAFDAAPLVVVYTRTEGGTVQVLFFTVGPGNEMRWTNASHVTTADQVFKRGPLLEASRREQPFSMALIVR